MDEQNPYLALLRRINVGGNNIIKMTDLKSFFEELEFTGVTTYIQSGNVLFKSDEKDKARLTDKIEKALSGRFNYNSRIVVISHPQLKKIIIDAPAGFGKEPSKFRYDVIFVKESLTTGELIKKVSIRDGVDKAWQGETVLYFSRLIIRVTQSHLSRIISIPEYQYITIRNWNTTSRLLDLMEK
ncbi:MAG: DUF1697 domain-containing protein [Bacteroidales bacterium]|nr:DUF1697 domain-containing protein [Bacteroidales bacterium]